MKKASKVYYFVGGALVLLAILITVLLVVVMSNTEDSTVLIQNSSPTNTNIKVCVNDSTPTSDCDGSTSASLVTLTTGAGIDTDFDLYMDVTDLNGVHEIASVAASFYREVSDNTIACDEASEEAFVSCYTNRADGVNIEACAAASDQSGIDSGITTRYKCDIALKYWASATSEGSDFSSSFWYLDMISTDINGSIDGGVLQTEIAEVSSIDFATATIAYGESSLGATSSPRIKVVATQFGNTSVDMTIQALSSVMACDNIGEIPVTNQRFGTDDASYEQLASALSTTAQDLDFETGTNNNKFLTRTSDSVDATDAVFFGIKIPDTGVLGTCSVSAVLTSVKQ